MLICRKHEKLLELFRNFPPSSTRMVYFLQISKLSGLIWDGNRYILLMFIFSEQNDSTGPPLSNHKPFHLNSVSRDKLPAPQKKLTLQRIHTYIQELPHLTFIPWVSPAVLHIFPIILSAPPPLVISMCLPGSFLPGQVRQEKLLSTQQDSGQMHRSPPSLATVAHIMESSALLWGEIMLSLLCMSH